MRRISIVIAAVIAAGCDRQPEPTNGVDRAERPASAPRTGTALAQPPSFDCARARGQAQELICADQELAAMDREVERLYRIALNDRDLGVERDQLPGEHEGWRRERDACGKADELKPCVAAAYGKRIAALRSLSPAAGGDSGGVSSGPLAYRCSGLEGPVEVTTIAIAPGSAHLHWRSIDVLMAGTEAASGAKYAGRHEGADWGFWTKGGEAILVHPDWGDLRCREQPVERKSESGRST